MDQPAPGGTTMTIRHLVLHLAPAPARTRMWLWLLAGVLPAMVAGVLFGYLAAQGRMAPTTALAGFVAIVLPALLVGIAIGKQMRGHRLVLRARDVGLVTGTYRQLLAYPELDLDRARVLDLDEHLEFRPRLKTSAMVLPGFQTGWYRLRNGSRALVARAGGKRVLWIPTTRGFGLLLQPREHPRELLQALREAAGRAASDGVAAPAPVEEKTYWFPAKQFGWGWGFPTAWQGWVVLGLFIVGIMALPWIVPEDNYMIGVAVLVALVTLVCFLKGEPPRWRWGDDNEF